MLLHSRTQSVVSKRKLSRLLIIAFCGAAAITSSAYSLTKRHATTHKSTAVAVIQHDKLAKGAKTVVVFRRDATPQTVILVDPKAPPPDLAGALSAVNRFRDKLRDSLPQKDLMLVPKPFPARHLSLGAERRMQKYLTALADNRNMKRIRGFGEHRVITVVLSSRRKEQ